MCDSKTKMAIDIVVEDLMGRGVMFTLYDVYRIMRASGFTAPYHAIKTDLRRVAERYGNDYDYSEALASIPGVPLQPVIYHPAGTDPNAYNPDALDGNTGQVTVQTGSAATPNDGAPTAASPTADAATTASRPSLDAFSTQELTAEIGRRVGEILERLVVD